MKYGKPRIAWKNLNVPSSLSASTQDYDFPVENILDSQSTKVWRSSAFGETTATITGVLPSDTLIDCYHVSGINISPASGTFQIDFYSNTTATGTPVYTDMVDNFDDVYGYGEFGYEIGGYSTGEGYGRDWARNVVTKFFDRAITIRSYKITLTDPDIILVGWFEVGTVFFGMTWSPKYGITDEYSVGFQSENQNLRSRSGFLASQDVACFKRLSLPLHMMEELEMADLYRIISNTYSKTPALCGVFTREMSTDELMGTIYGSLISPPTFQREAATRRFKTTLVFEEAK